MSESATDAPVAEAPSDPVDVESRWPPTLALLGFMALNVAVRIWLPNEAAVRAPWLVPAIEAVLLVALLRGNPARLAARAPWARPVAVGLVVVLVCAALWATVVLVYDLVEGTGVTTSPTQLLASGALVWLGNNLAFAMLYWLMDSGGPIGARAEPGAGRLRVHAADEPRARSRRVAAGLPRLPAPRASRTRPHSARRT